MRTNITILFVLSFFAAIAIAVYYYWLFTQWPPAVWKRRLKAKWAEFQAAIDRVDRDPSAQAEQKLKQQHLEAGLHAIPLERLADYPNIGPKTVEAVAAGGFKRIDQLWTLNWWHSVPGIGDVRAKALTEAAKIIKTDFETRFEQGSNPEGKAWLAERERMREVNRAAAEERARIKAAALQAQKEIQPLMNLSEAVSFSSFLTHRNNSPITNEIMARPFPEMIVDAPKSNPVPPAAPSTPTAPAPTSEPTIPKTSTASPPANPLPSAPITSPATPISRSPVSPPAVIAIDETELERVRTYCRFGFVVARADGRVAVGEKKEIRSFLQSTFESNSQLLDMIDPIIEQCENPPPVENDAVAAIKLITTPAQREELMTWARRIADVVGDRNQKEQKLLDRIAQSFDQGQANPPTANTMNTSAPPAASNARAILEIADDVELSPELIRRRFNILTDQYDPKRAASLGAAFVAKAEEMRAAVKAAAESLIAPFGVPLIAPSAPPAAPSGDLRHNPDLDAIFGM